MLYAIDKCINEYEFRGFVIWYLKNHDYTFISVDDELLNDEDRKNDNDIIVSKDNIKYTVQVFLNKPITEYRIKETNIDMEKERVIKGIIFTNLEVSKEEKDKAMNKNITILDRSNLEEEYNNYNK